MNNTIILIIAACLIILYIVIKAFPKSTHISNVRSQEDHLKPGDDNTDSYTSSTKEIGTVNSFLHEQELTKNIYIVKQVFFKPGNTNMVDRNSEKVFNKGSDVIRNSNKVRLKEAQKYFDITCQNILFRKSMGKTDGRMINSFMVTLSCVQHMDGIIKTTILKTIDQDNIDTLGSFNNT